MRILYLNHNVAFAGGTFFRALHFAEHLARRGHELTLIAISPARRRGFSARYTQGVRILESPDLLWGLGRTGWDPWDCVSRMWAIRREAPYDVIHAWDSRPVVVLPALRALALAPRRPLFVMDWCDWWGRGGTQAERPHRLLKHVYGPVETFFEERFRTRADLTTVASALLRQRAEQLGVRSTTISFLPGGCDTARVVPIEARNAKLQLGLDPDTSFVGCMGAINANDARLLLGALAEVRKKRPTVRLLAIGLRVAGGAHSLADLADGREREAIHDVGRQPFEKVGLYLGACEVLLLPLRNTLSNSARWPSKLNDYLSAARPVVGTRVGEVTGIVDNFGVGTLCDDTPEAMSAATLNLLDDPAMRARCGAAGRALAQGTLNWANLTVTLEQLYSHATQALRNS